MQRAAVKSFLHHACLFVISFEIIVFQIFSSNLSNPYHYNFENKFPLSLGAMRTAPQYRTKSYQITSVTNTYIQQELFWPLYGKITSKYGMRRHPFTHKVAFHTGIDIRAKSNTPIICPLDGIVVSARRAGAMGREVRIQAGDKLLIFGHLAAFKCKPGETVRAGQILGFVGVSGKTTGPHLHFAIKINNQWVNPMIYLEPHNLVCRL